MKDLGVSRSKAHWVADPAGLSYLPASSPPTLLSFHPHPCLLPCHFLWPAGCPVCLVRWLCLKMLSLGLGICASRYQAGPLGLQIQSLWVRAGCWDPHLAGAGWGMDILRACSFNTQCTGDESELGFTQRWWWIEWRESGRPCFVTRVNAVSR